MTTQPAPRPPGPRGHWLYGVTLDLRRDPINTMVAIWREFGDIAHLPLGGPFTGLLVVHPDQIKHVLQDNNRNYPKVPWYQWQLQTLVGNGLLTSEGDFWLRQRRLAQPAFHRQRIEALGATMVAATTAMLDEWDRAAAGGPLVFDLAHEMMRLTLTIVGQTLLGADVTGDVEAVSRAVNVAMPFVERRIESYWALPVWFPTPANWRFRRAKRSLDTIIYRIIAERRQANDDRGDLLSMLLAVRDEETGVGMTELQLRDEIMTMFLAGHETTALALTWAWHLLDQNPAVAAALRAEVDATLGGCPPTVADVPRLPYTRQVLDETMRLYPPAWALSRMPLAVDVIGGYRVDRRTFVYLSPYLTHRHPAFWTEPECFNPNRFTPDQAEKRPRYAYFPFGGGPRQCIGNNFALMEGVLILATVAQRYTIATVPGHPVEPDPSITLRLKHGLRVTVTPRQTEQVDPGRNCRIAASGARGVKTPR